MSDPGGGGGSGAPPPRVAPVARPGAVRLTQVPGGQYVFSATTGSQPQYSQQQLPPLTQITSIVTTNTALSQGGVTRIMSLSPSRANASVTSATTVVHQTIVNALTRSPQIITSGIGGSPLNVVRSPTKMFVTSTSLPVVSSPNISPAKKRLKLTDGTDLITSVDDSTGLRRRILEHRLLKLQSVKDSYKEHVAELFFLQHGGDAANYMEWRKRPQSQPFLQFAQAHRLESNDETTVELLQQQPKLQPIVAAPPLATIHPPSVSGLPAGAEIKMAGVGVTPVAVSTTLPAAVAQLSQQGGTPLVPESHGQSVVPGRVIPASVGSPSDRKTRLPSASALALSALSNKNKNGAVASNSSVSSNQEQIVEKAKQEAYVMQRITDLQREGLWTERRLPKVQEPPRPKVHWDYLLEEMCWLSADFAQERKWKKAAAKKCARMVQKYFQDKAAAAQKAEKAQELHMRRICAFIAKEVRTFWANAQKLVEYKQQARLEEKRKQALDQHLSFIVDQTEKYSQLLAEGMNKSGVDANTSAISSRVPTPMKLDQLSDDEFNPGNQSSSDDEETIAQAEAEAAKESEGYVQELADLQRESEMDLNTLLKDYLQNRDKESLKQEGSDIENDFEEDNVSEKENKHTDEEFEVKSENEESDVEETIEEQEKIETEQEHKTELDDLKKLNEMSLDDLKKMYSNLPSPPETDLMDMEVDSTNTNDTDKSDDSSEDEESDITEAEDTDIDIETNDESDSFSEEETKEDDVGLKSLLVDTDDSRKDNDKADDEDNLINDAAALAESIQPKGNTLSSTSVVTPIPFLLKHQLREYQHIGLDWLVTMFERKLNGILADEMGLGKTIQTIALLAHLACEKGDWGPHLIIVPTSVMLNWEMECKKWCPGFKILTYYGTQKERKMKRMGWTKPNAFHICITSYKLVIQDHQSFRRKKWKYLILDEAQNIKNFKSQRWQLLLNFQTQQRLLLTGTPLQNNLMELWSLMHFLMPHIFQSHREFKEWFSNPVTGMIEGNSEYNESIIKRLHKVLRPFLLRRLKCEVEKQMPKKYEHVIMCRLSKRQRYLYDDFMSRAKTRETLATGNLLSVINVLMQLRKVCNHPNLFEVRPTISPFQMEGIQYNTASLVYGLFEYDPMKHIDLFTRHILLSKLENALLAVNAHRVRQLKTPRRLIEEIDTVPEVPPPCPKGHIRLKVKLGEPKEQKAITTSNTSIKTIPNRIISTSAPTTTVTTQQGLKFRLSGASGVPLQGVSLPLQIFQQGGGLKAIPIGTPISTAGGTVQPTIQLKHADGTQGTQTVGYAAQIVQTSTGKHILLASSSANVVQTHLQPIANTVMTSSGQRLAVLSKTPLVATNSGNKMTTPTKAVLFPVIDTSPQKISQVVTSVTATNHITNATDAVNEKNSEKTAIPFNITLTQPLNASLINQLSVQSTPSQNLRSSESPMKPTHDKKDSLFYDPQLEKRKRKFRNQKLRILARFNEERCSAFPLYGEDLRAACDVFTPGLELFEDHPAYRETTSWTARGYAHCREAMTRSRTQAIWKQTEGLMSAIRSVDDRIDDMKDVLDRFVFFVPAVQAPMTRFHVSHPPPNKLWSEQRMAMKLQKDLSEPCAPLHTIRRNMATQFPDPRLIQFDCGKLQTLDVLLRKLKTEGHRILIFTQMTRMLDVLESFLNYHGHIYLRLDGTTKIDQRQVLMERFNGDKRIFAFILSTRSGGVGVNLTGADTVIFYDSDWNPTMDAQAQDRCHRIGQTRDVHIYRLVSEKTIEENILKKANQKRMLGDLAIEGGNFTTAYFKSTTIQDLFNIDNNEDASARMSEVVNREKERKERLTKLEEVNPISPVTEDRSAVGALETALAACEDEQDVQAARTAKAEAVAELAEFDESIPLEEERPVTEAVAAALGEDQGAVIEPELSKAELEVQNLVKQLTPIEQYAMRFVEENEANWSAQQLAAAEAEIEAQKREWESNRLAALREEEESRKQRQKEEDDIITYSREDAINQVWISNDGNEQMPMWCPPTPPQNDNDVYIDHTLDFLYERNVMSESQLPPAYMKKEPKRARHEAGLSDGRRPVKVHRKEENVYAPRSLFDRPSPALMKMRRDLKLQKYRGIIRPPVPSAGLKMPPISKPQPEPEGVLEWLIYEDMALLQAVQVYQGLPLNLVVLSPGHTPNWDLVADFVNNTSRIYRSPKQCKNRYEQVIVPREEGKLLYDTNPKKQKKTKGSIHKTPQQTKGNRPMRTSQLYTQDNNQSFSYLSVQRFDVIKLLSNKRAPTTKPTLGNPTLKNPKHTAILAQSGVTYDMPPNPVDVATKRAERIAKEKLKNSTAAVAVATTTVNAVQNALTLAKTQASQNVGSVSPGQSSGSSQSPGPQPISSATLVGNISSSVPASVVQTQGSVASALRAQRIGSAIATQGSNVSVSGLTAHLQAQRLIVATPNMSGVTAKGIPAGTVTAGGKQITPAQFQMYRQQFLKQHQSRQIHNAALLQQQQLQGSVVGTVTKVVTTTSVNTVTTQAQTINIQQGQVTPTAQRVQLIKQVPGGVNVGKQTIARAVSETEVTAMIKRQQQLQQQQIQQKALAVASGTAQAGTGVHTQMFAQGAFQVQHANTTGVTATLVKAVSTPTGTSAVTIPVSSVTLGPGGQVKAALPPGVKATSATQQIRQLQIHPHQLLAQRSKLPANTKVAQLTQVTANKALIVQTPKNLPATMTMQQLQQVMRVQGANAGQPGTQQLVLTKPGVARAGGSVLPSQHALKQTIQVGTYVVTASSAAQIASGIRPQVSVQSTLAGALSGTLKVGTSQALLSQVSAALQGQPVSVSVRPGGNPVRIQTSTSGSPLVSVSVQSPTVSQVQQITTMPVTQQTAQDGQQQSTPTSVSYRVLKK